MNFRTATLAALVAISAMSGSAFADERFGPGYDNAPPVYDRWQQAWDRFEYDRHHVILGTVISFQPYRLQVARRDGQVQMIDLKHGTVIRPTGATPQLNERIAIVGYYSNGTFIANRVIIRS